LPQGEESGGERKGRGKKGKEEIQTDVEPSVKKRGGGARRSEKRQRTKEGGEDLFTLAKAIKKERGKEE